MLAEPIRLDALTAARRLAGLPGFAWLDSAGGPAALARYSYLVAAPFEIIAEPSLDRLAERLRPHHAEPAPGLPPFQGGAVGVFGYDLGRTLERLPAPAVDEFRLPPLHVGLYDWCVSFDHHANEAWVVARTPQRLRQAQAWLRDGTGPPVTLPRYRVAPQRFAPLPFVRGLGSQFTRPQFEAAVRRGVEYVHAGDCFQVNLAQRLLVPEPEPPFALYERLRAINPAPFAGYYDAGTFAVVSASPERFVQLLDGVATARPIKGTRPRGRTAEEDVALAADLLASDKDRAENVMIVDLLRNDLGRVCRYGSVRVEEVCSLETYPTVHHLVSGVRGELRPGLTAVDLLKAAFPGGSVTGAPKVRAMEIIAELEGVSRGPYCGSLGYVSFGGAMDASILIRTFTQAGGWCQFPVGGGIVADSDPAREYDETLHKAAGLLRALPGGAEP